MSGALISGPALSKDTGLGKSVVHGIVRRHRGGITVTSDAWRGTVRIYLPAATSTAGAAKPYPTSAMSRGLEETLAARRPA